MLIVRWLALALLLTAAVCFGVYAATGQVRFKRLGFAIFKWTVIAGVGRPLKPGPWILPQASCTPKVQADITSVLGLRDPALIKG
ncbi:MAG: hypothetical protein ACK5OA_07065, partial [Acidovorax sp.]